MRRVMSYEPDCVPKKLDVLIESDAASSFDRKPLVKRLICPILICSKIQLYGKKRSASKSAAPTVYDTAVQTLPQRPSLSLLICREEDTGVYFGLIEASLNSREF